jgi:hypothetical protein
MDTAQSGLRRNGIASMNSTKSLHLAPLLMLALTGCQTSPSIISICPPIPASLTADCYVEAPTPVTNGQLAEQWIELRSCALEQSIKLQTVAGLAECRVNASK